MQKAVTHRGPLRVHAKAFVNPQSNLFLHVRITAKSGPKYHFELQFRSLFVWEDLKNLSSSIVHQAYDSWPFNRCSNPSVHTVVLKLVRLVKHNAESCMILMGTIHTILCSYTKFISKLLCILTFWYFVSYPNITCSHSHTVPWMCLC